MLALLCLSVPTALLLQFRYRAEIADEKPLSAIEKEAATPPSTQLQYHTNCLQIMSERNTKNIEAMCIR